VENRRDEGFSGGDAAGAALVVVVAGGAAAGASQASTAGPYLTFAAAIIVALITWFATDRRQTRALAAEGERQVRSLDAERARLVLELKHTRAMADLAGLRGLLDEAAVALHRASYARDDVWRVGPAGVAQADHERSDPSRPGIAARLAAAGTALDELAERLAIRLGPETSAVVEFGHAADALRAIDIEINRPHADDVEQFNAFRSASDAFSAARNAFVAAAAVAGGAQAER
jgi:hypothetical protein